MNETKHTPTSGPWYVAETGNHQGLIISESTAANVAVAYDKKDAPLLAAAPELLEALRGMISAMWQHWEYYHDGEDGLDNVSCNFALDKARAAIAKATGGAA